ncbi:Rne/Rng family ribonuclease, partial [Bifidobacterium bifidum]
YTPVDDEEPSEDSGTRSRRRRRSRQNRADDSRGNGESDSSQSAAQQDEPAKPSSRRTRDEEEDDDSNVTRRRRRRRSRASDEQGDDEMTVRRSRKQQYIDEITDVEGSTRLEAKKQRRRDNRRERSRQSQLVEQDFLARREHVNRLMVVRERGHHTQISVIEDNVLVEHYVSDIQEVATVGNIYLGRVQNVLPSMEAAFVDIGQSRNGVLYAGEVNWDATRLEGQPRRIELAFKSGDPVLVQVTKDPIGHKGARLTSQVTLAGRFLVLVPSGGMTGVSRKLSERERSRLKGIVSKIAPKDMGVIIRTAAEGAKEEAIVKDLESLVRQWERINAKREEFWHGKRPKLLQGEPDVAIRVVRDIFNDNFGELIVEGDKVYERIEEYLDTMAPDLKEKLSKWDPSEHQGKDVFDKWQIDAQLRKGMERQVYLPSGGSIVIDRTEAMTTIDVNTGRFIGRGKSLEETVTRCNLEAAEEIARQLRLRDIGGMVMIDFVDMVMPANRDLVLRRLVECLARDRTKHQVAEVTSLGLVQMTRKRIGQGLVEAFSEECPTCHGRGFILHDEPTVSADYDDPYALKGGDPFIKTNKHGRGTDVQVPQGSSPDIKAKLAQIAAAAVAANGTDEDE